MLAVVGGAGGVRLAPARRAPVGQRLGHDAAAAHWRRDAHISRERAARAGRQVTEARPVRAPVGAAGQQAGALEQKQRQLLLAA
jgi:hypothetical protein